MIGKIFVVWSEKTHKTVTQIEKTKIPKVSPFFNIELYRLNDFVIEKWVNRRHFFIDKESFQNFGLTEDFNSVYPYYMIIFLSEVDFWCYDWLSSG